MRRPNWIELGHGSGLTRIPILHEDRSVLAIDKPAGWMLVPFSWQRTQKNLAAALTSSIAAGDFWARIRSIRFLRNVHRLDADTTGVLLLAKSVGALKAYGEMFKSRRMEKTYLAVVHGTPPSAAWTCRTPINRDLDQIGRMRPDASEGLDAETSFQVRASRGNISLLEARPLTGRTHQIRVHLHEAGHPVVGDDIYLPRRPAPISRDSTNSTFPLGLRAVVLAYFDPFLRRRVQIEAPQAAFLEAFGFVQVTAIKRHEPLTPRRQNLPTCDKPSSSAGT